MTAVGAPGRTQRLDLADATLREWTATVLAAEPERGVLLDRSAFYPGGGGQPPDHGVLLWGGVQTRVVGTRREDGDDWLVPAEDDPLPPAGTAVRGAVEDARRTALMRTHSGLHLLSGVVFRDFGALVTGSNMEPLEGRLDFNLDAVPEGFTATNLLPPSLEVVRIVDIAGLDVQADGGTHVASTRQIGGLEVVKVENKGKGFRRIRVRLPPPATGAV